MLIVAEGTSGQVLPQNKGAFSWDTLPSIPDSVGFAGSFAGVADGALVVAGGSNFPGGGTPWNGGVKKWYDKIFVLEKPNDRWKEAARLPFALGYGVSVSTSDGLILIGGSNKSGHYSDVLKINYRNGKLDIEKLPSLPFPLANMCGALVGNKIFIAGGLSAPNSSKTENAFLCFDLQKKNGGWKRLPTWSGPSRMLSVAGSDGKQFFLFSGTELVNGTRVYLRDAYAFSEKDGWKQLADLPNAVVAAPSPSFFNKQSLYIFGGDTGKDAKQAAELKEKHPGFSDVILSYDIMQNKWWMAGRILTKRKEDAEKNPNNSTWAPVTTTLAVWNNQIVLPGGEVRPATRTPNVITGSPHPSGGGE